MATLRDSLAADMSGYTPVEPVARPVPPPIEESGALPRNTFLRCPLPPTNADPDSLRQFYIGGKVPQMRLLPPPAPVTGSGGTSTPTAVSVSSTAVAQAVTQAVTQATNSQPNAPSPNGSITTPALAPGGQYQGSIQLSKSFTVQQVSVSSAARVRLYSTKSAQSTDAGRNSSTLVANQTQHGVILDVVIDDANNLKWILSPAAAGANGDNPQTSTAYVTVDNLGSSAVAVTAGLVYTNHVLPSPIVTINVNPNPPTPRGGRSTE